VINALSIQVDELKANTEAMGAVCCCLHFGYEKFRVLVPCPARAFSLFLLVQVLWLATACTTTPSTIESLQQAPPRDISASLQLPDDAVVSHVIPGLGQGAVPQGMSYAPESDVLLTSHYFDTAHPSCIVAIDWKTGKARHTAKLQEPGGDAHYGHVGGIVVAASALWVASDAYLYRYDLQQVLTSDTVVALDRFKTEASSEVAFCSAYGGKVWAGEFALPGKYPTDPSHHLVARDGDLRHGWISGYDPATGFDVPPERVLSIPDRAQGMVATEEYVFLSISYGRRNPSSVEIFRNPLGQSPHAVVSTSAGAQAPLWYLDGLNHVRSIELPPMAENIVIIDGKLAVLFESGANKFRWFGKPPLDHIVLLDLQELNPR
jgi:hypothetical protein